jgi:murein DD-endopeptidase MepM/ murein hydrolase activator NlpD
MLQYRSRFLQAEQLSPLLLCILDTLRVHRIRCLTSVGIFLGLFVAASAIASLGEREHTHAAVSGKAIEIDLALPGLDEQARLLDQQEQVFVTEERLRSGDSLGNLLSRLGATDPAALQFIRTDALASLLLKSRPGIDISARINHEGRLLWMRYPVVAIPSTTASTSAQQVPASRTRVARATSRRAAPTTKARRAAARSAVVSAPASATDAPMTQKTFVTIERSGQHFRATQQTLALERRVEYRSGVIQTSLYAAADKAGVPDEVVRDLADIFESQIDFYFNLRKGDAFRVAYETYSVQGRYSHTGRVLSAEIINRGRPLQAVWFETSPGRGNYYDLNGLSLKSSFLRTPLQYSRVSSGFSDARLHPIHMRWQAHTGVDYAAPTGTPVRAVSDGVVTFAGWQNGYGNVIYVKHSGIYSTVYAHLSRINPDARKGARISQGQFIGEVGSTGWATGPHLHYEVRLNNVPQNPLTVALPNASPIDRHLKPAFMAQVQQTRHQLALLSIAPVATR